MIVSFEAVKSSIKYARGCDMIHMRGSAEDVRGFAKDVIGSYKNIRGSVR